MHYSYEAMILKCDWHRCMSQQSKAYFNYLFLFSLNFTILMSCIRTNQSMHNYNVIEKIGERLEFSPIVKLQSFDFGIELSSHISLK